VADQMREVIKYQVSKTSMYIVLKAEPIFTN